MSDLYPDLPRIVINNTVAGTTEEFRVRRRSYMTNNGKKLWFCNRDEVTLWQSLSDCDRWLVFQPDSTEGLAWVTIDLPLEAVSFPTRTTPIDYQQIWNTEEWFTGTHNYNRTVVQLHPRPPGFVLRPTQLTTGDVQQWESYGVRFPPEEMFNQASEYGAVLPKCKFDFTLQNDPSLIDDIIWNGIYMSLISSDFSLPGGTPDYDDCNQ